MPVLNLCTCARVTVVILLVCVSVTMLAATYLIYLLQGASTLFWHASGHIPHLYIENKMSLQFVFKIHIMWISLKTLCLKVLVTTFALFAS